MNFAHMDAMYVINVAVHFIFDFMIEVFLLGARIYHQEGFRDGIYNPSQKYWDK